MEGPDGPQPQPLPIPTTGLTYRRRVELAVAPGRVEAEMEDTHHHFVVLVEHDGEHVTGARAEGRRLPWSSCATGAAGVGALVGRPLVEVVGNARWAADRSTTCVHAVDLAVLALAHHDHPGTTRYEVRLHDPGRTRSRLTVTRDGAEVLAWDLEGADVVGPDPYTGQRLRGPELLAWARDTLDPDQVEVIGIARRAAHVGRSRAMDLDAYATAADVMVPDRSCHTYQLDVAPTARRQVGSSRATELDPSAQA